MSERLFACAVCGHQAVLDPWRDLGNGVATFDPPSCAAHPRPVAMREVAQDVHHHRPLGSDGGGAVSCGWVYRCGGCGELVEVDDVRGHIEVHRHHPGWSGHISLAREDKQRATDSNGHSEINGENEAKEGW